MHLLRLLNAKNSFHLRALEGITYMIPSDLVKFKCSDLILVPLSPSRHRGSNGANASVGTDSSRVHSMDSRNSKKILQTFTTLRKTDRILSPNLPHSKKVADFHFSKFAAQTELIHLVFAFIF